MFEKYLLVVWLLIFTLISMMSSAGAQDAFLSNLSATKDSPLYTTYAAALERSEFVLDEGFHFLFYDPERGLDFITDTAGDWCLAFMRDSVCVYEVGSMFRESVIHASYPDIVEYSYFPYEDVRADATFFVYSSLIAVQEVRLTNTGGNPVDLKVIPFLRNDYRTFDEIDFHPDEYAVTCMHEELPDGWVLSHEVPYVLKVYDVFMLSESPDRMSSFRSYSGESARIPHEVDLDRKQVYVVRGRMHHQDGERCHHASPKPRFMVILNDDESRLLTDTAPRWGSSSENVNRYAFYNVELGNFGRVKEGDQYSIRLMCGETGEYAEVEGAVGNLSESDGIRTDVTFAPLNMVPAPSGLEKTIGKDGKEIRLVWEGQGSGVRYNVYRRNYRKSSVYTLIAEKIDQNFFIDENIDEAETVGYVVAAVDTQNRMGMVSEEVTNLTEKDFLSSIKSPHRIGENAKNLARVIGMEKRMTLEPGESKRLRMVRGFGRDEDEIQDIVVQAKTLMEEDLEKYVRENERLFSRIPRLTFDDPDKEMLYWNAFSLMRQVMLPPEGKSSYNYYVFSREPTWGWGHGGQVFHESLTMLAYAHMDGASAMNSQRVYRERQYESGYINYRTGSYLDEIIETDGELTSSAPWYAWQNWEVYRITQDVSFLKEMYESSKRFYDYYVANRDKDGDGLCEWGAHAVLESVRDAWVAIWDEVGWPSLFEGVDVNAMLVKEAKSLALMAEALGYSEEAEKWKYEARSRADRINAVMWDGERGFYFHVDKTDNDFTHKAPDDLKREEIVGFLPLWAGVADHERAERLVQKLTDPNKFWRKYGVPTLAADDPYYNPKGYWNGPVWVEWNALIVDGLIQYGYDDEVRELVDRVAQNMIARLKKDHNFWEFYSPDEDWGGYHKTYIWAGIIARMLMDVGVQCNP